MLNIMVSYSCSYTSGSRPGWSLARSLKHHKKDHFLLWNTVFSTIHIPMVCGLHLTHYGGSFGKTVAKECCSVINYPAYFYYTCKVIYLVIYHGLIHFFLERFASLLFQCWHKIDYIAVRAPNLMGIEWPSLILCLLFSEAQWWMYWASFKWLSNLSCASLHFLETGKINLGSLSIHIRMPAYIYII